MTDELKDKAAELAGKYLATLRGKAKEFYETRAEVKDLMQRNIGYIATLSVELLEATDDARRASLRESIATAEDSITNEIAGLAQDVKTEAGSAIADGLRMIAGFAKEALPTVLELVLRRT